MFVEGILILVAAKGCFVVAQETRVIKGNYRSSVAKGESTTPPHGVWVKPDPASFKNVIHPDAPDATPYPKSSNISTGNISTPVDLTPNPTPEKARKASVGSVLGAEGEIDSGSASAGEVLTAVPDSLIEEGGGEVEGHDSEEGEGGEAAAEAEEARRVAEEAAEAERLAQEGRRAEEAAEEERKAEAEERRVAGEALAASEAATAAAATAAAAAEAAAAEEEERRVGEEAAATGSLPNPLNTQRSTLNTQH